MKIAFLLSFVSIYAACAMHKHDKMNSKKVYQAMNELGSTDYLVIEQKSDSLFGFWISAEEDMNHAIIYYCAPMENLSIKENKISFTLSDYTLSSRPISPTSLSNLERIDQINLPLFTTMTYYFTGEIADSDVELLRTSDLYDSRADSLRLFLQTN